VKHDAGSEDRGGVVAGYHEGDKGIKTDRGTDVDEGTEKVYEGCYADCLKRKGGASVDLWGTNLC